MTLKILVADDSVTIQKIVSLAFSGEDAVVQSASDGDSALDAIRDFKPDIVLADVLMPGCSGYEVCARIKEDPALSQTPVLLLAGAFEPFDESEASRVRSDGRLTKPFDTEELIETVHRLAGAGAHPEISDTLAEYSAGANREEPPGVVYNGKAGGMKMKSMVNARIWNSFVGSDRILDLFDSDALAAAGTKQFEPPAVAAAQSSSVSGIPMSEEVLDAIVERVVKRISADVVREVAWEVVPELSESIIRRTLEERNKP